MTVYLIGFTTEYCIVQSYGQALAKEMGEDEGPCGDDYQGRAEAETGRRHRLDSEDAVNNISLAVLLEQKLSVCRACRGDDAMTYAMSTVDAEVLQQLQRLAQNAT
jgi:hypothetical protein